MRAIVLLALLAATAHADDSVDKPEAVRLFEEGRAALEAGNFDAACKSFALSLKKDPRAVGTLLNLGLCNERQGKVASALALFIEAYDRATEASSVEQRNAAEEHIATLRPQVPFLVLERSGAPLSGEKLLIDDRVIDVDEREIPVDPGTHDVTLTAPGRLPYETQVTVKVSDRVKLALPILEVPKEGTTKLVRESWRRTWGKPLTFGGGGLVVLGLGGIWFAKNRYNNQFEGANAPCSTVDGAKVCTREGKSKVDSARTIATSSVVVGGLGLFALAAGMYLWWSAPNEVVVVPVVTGDTAGASLTLRF